jgi:hypothetical protein
VLVQVVLNILENIKVKGSISDPIINVNTDLSYDVKSSVQIQEIKIQMIPADNVKSRPFFELTDKLIRKLSSESFAMLL